MSDATTMLVTSYLWLLACIGATFALVAFCFGMVLLTRGIYWIGENASDARQVYKKARQLRIEKGDE